jgi:hypothetical protein
MMNITSVYMAGNADHAFTDVEKIALADAIITLAKDVDANVNIDAVLNFKK